MGVAVASESRRARDGTAREEPGGVTATKQQTSEPVRLLVAGDQTQNRFALVEIATRSGEEPPLHIHTREDELVYVVRGEVVVHLDGTERRCAAGECALLPMGSEHTWRVDSGEATLLILATPAGLEGYYAALADPVEPDRRVERLIAASARYGVEIVGPAPAGAS
jgi:quercetin dioxygenase-like cupin family protein